MSRHKEHIKWMHCNLNIMNPENHVNQGIWIDRNFEKATKVYEEFSYKLERENRFLSMLHLAVDEIRKVEL